MKDPIERQAAIDALHMHLMYRMGTDSNKKRLDDWINSLPSAQPEKRTEERTETHACDYQRTETHDLVSRRAALEAMDTWDKFGCDPDGKLVRCDDDKHYIPYVHYEDMVHAVKNLPSAQPEIIYCGECKHMMPNGKCRQFADSTIRPSASDFCSAGERKDNG